MKVPRAENSLMSVRRPGIVLGDRSQAQHDQFRRGTFEATHLYNFQAPRASRYTFNAKNESTESPMTEASTRSIITDDERG